MSQRSVWCAALGVAAVAGIICLFALLPDRQAEDVPGQADREDVEPAFVSIEHTHTLPEVFAETVQLAEGQVVEISARLLQPSSLPPNARARITWELVDKQLFASRFPTELKDAEQGGNPPPADGNPDSNGESKPTQARIRNAAPTADWNKLLHALDGDVYVVYRAPVTGAYRLRVEPFEERAAVFGQPTWREQGGVPQLHAADRPVPWPSAAAAQLRVRIGSIDLQTSGDLRMLVETEPNDTPEQAVRVVLPDAADEYSLQIMGGCDDVDYFDNGFVGSSGDDWYRLEFSGTESRLLSACLSIPDQQVVARIRCYSLQADQATMAATSLLPITREYRTGKNLNERVHQQVEPHRIAINRKLRPGYVYFLRVEANAPGYELELRVVEPAPYDNPQRAVRQALYDHLGQVDAWLSNRPRAISVERRIRDTGNLLGTGCMSCHTQAGVWGPAIAFKNGYRPQNVQLMRNLVNICYQSMRPTNELIDAANNASLAPLDLGDGPAGTRVAGHAVVAYERYRSPRKLQSLQAIRAANNVLQTADPTAVNAAGPGANVGSGVVLNYAGEVVWSAWLATQNPQYFRATEDKARALLKMTPRFTDDICHRVEFLKRFFPANYTELAEQVSDLEQNSPTESRVPYKSTPTAPADAAALQQRIDTQVAEDLQRLRAIQNEDGSWGFDPGKADENGGWKRASDLGEPSPTALALIALHAAGTDRDDPAVANGVQALLGMQHPSGLWKGASLTGFVSTAYALSALGWWFPVEPTEMTVEKFTPAANDSLMQSIRRVRDLSNTENAEFVPLMRDAAAHDSPLVRYWALIGLGGTADPAGITELIQGLGDDAKLVREAAHWGLRQVLIDDHGWDAVLQALASQDDYTREAAVRTLVMRVDGVLPKISIAWDELSRVISSAMNEDAHPAVRAWAIRAAWNWWYWNPPLRKSLNAAWLEMLQRDEPDLLVENTVRYQSHALFIVNGHNANESTLHQYRELAELFAQLTEKVRAMPATQPENRARQRIINRLTGIASTYYATAGGDGGAGQLGYSTPGADELFGEALLQYLNDFDTEVRDAHKLNGLQIALEAAANITHDKLQQELIHYSLNGPEYLRVTAASSVSDPRSATLVAVPEMIEPLVAQIHRGALDPPRRPQLSDPLIKLFRRVRWMVPTNIDQQREILGYLIPDLEDYLSREAILALPDAAGREEADRRMEANWYLASELGDVLGENPDLHFDTVFEFFPERVQTPLQARFWLPSVDWIMAHKLPLPLPGEDWIPAEDPFAEIRQRALALFVQQLGADAEPRTRKLAVEMAYSTPLRQRPEVQAALAQLPNITEEAQLLRHSRNAIVVQQELQRQLQFAVRREDSPEMPRDAAGQVVLSDEFVNDFRFFIDHVMPELNRPQRGDQRSCFSCHGVPDRVPSLTLNRPNSVGYLPVTKVLENYRLLQRRINLAEADRSKLLRKPLNVLSEQEEGHQGGLRYRSTDPGYLILRNWARNQAQHAQQVGLAP